MLGSASEAEDILQEAYIRVRNTPSSELRSPGAFFTTIVTRLCIDYKRSARARRETYVGEWLPEPIATRTDTDPVQTAQLISQAFLVVLESLSPLARAAYLLREVFGYSYEEIATALDRDERACRQLVSRANREIAERRPRFAPSHDDHRRLVENFAQVIQTGDVSRMEQLLSSEVVAVSDGGGLPGIAQVPVRGRAKVALFFTRLMARAPDGFRLEVREINGWPALVGYWGERLYSVMQLETDGQEIVSIRTTVNPDKLRFVHEVAT
jgi:RNA polymerase sigma-70 factor (ECF subfamily)